jgi:hypothetical protein
VLFVRTVPFDSVRHLRKGELDEQLPTQHEMLRDNHARPELVLVVALVNRGLLLRIDEELVSRVGGEADDERVADHLRQPSFLSFPYLCLEPVLVKRSHLHTNGSKLPFSHTAR